MSANLQHQPAKAFEPARLFTARKSSLLADTVAEYSKDKKWDLERSPRVERLMQNLEALGHAKHRLEGGKVIPSIPEDAMTLTTVERRALGLALALEKSPIYIQDDELIVGGKSLYGSARETGPSTFPGLANAQSVSWFPKYTTAEEDKKAGMPGGAASNHNVIGYGRLLDFGLDGLRRAVRGRSAELRGNPDSLEQSDLDRRLAFLSAAEVALAGLSLYARRYAELARQMAETANDDARKAELLEIGRITEKISTRKPETFHEALQLFYFARVASMIESYGCMPLGRFDQYLLPFYESSRKSGLGYEKARELIEALFIKLNEEIDLSSTDDCQRIMLSGQTPAGQDATNELSYLCLEVAARLRLPSPKVGVRLHKRTPEEFFERVVSTIRLGIAGLPEIYNDESIIPPLLALGFPLEDALDYCHDGCAEITIGGKCDFYPVWAGIRHLRILSNLIDEWPDGGGFDELFEAYLKRLRETIVQTAERGNARDRDLAEISPAPFMSITLEGCLERALDKTWGGCTYNMTGLLGSELVNAANALAALKGFVYEDRVMPLSELRKALDGDFAGLEGERLRLRLRNRYPKFGNDDETVDSIAARVASVFIEEGLKQKNPRGGYFFPGFYDFAGFVTQVRTLRATPDGRRAGESVSGHLAPVGGTDRNGVTANLQSMSKVTGLNPPMGTMFDVKLHPSAVRGEDGAKKMRALIETFMALDGKAIQFNIVDAKTLKEAQANPEKYRDLLVRVWGFSAYFVELSSDFQEHIINRTEHGL